TPLDLISLYHLQNFSPKKLPLKDCFITVLGRFKESAKDLSEVAFHLPHCASVEALERDAQALMGAARSEGIAKILGHKREQIRSREETERAIERKKLELKELRRGNPDNYPPYFDELLEGGYLHLFEHLVAMEGLSSPADKEAKIKAMSFSLLSHVVLETREAVVQKVVNALIDTMVMPIQLRIVLFLIGGTGAGKSTTMCLFRGDEMELIIPGYFYASKNDRDRLIGHKGATSCTFLPTTEVVGDLIIVDFPGFEDSKGRIVALGLECALIELIETFRPKILALESITNNNDKYAGAAKLGSRLSRLLANKDCILGITKYSKDPDSGAIRTIEEQQRKERETPSAEELGIIGTITTLSAMNLAALQPAIEEQQQKLQTVQQARLQKLKEPLPETEQKAKHRKEVEQREKDLSTAIGLSEIVKFDDLERAGVVDICRGKLSSCPQSSANTQPVLDSSDKEAVVAVFTNDLLPKMLERKDYHLKFEDFKDFESRVLESSLIRTIFEESNPEIGRFLHLRAIDPKIVREFDLKIVSDCISKCRKALIQLLDIDAINKTLEEIKEKASEQKVKEVEEKILRLQKYIMDMSGVTVLNNPGEMQKKWARLRADFNASTDVVETKAAPSWLEIACIFPLINYGIGALIDWRLRKYQEQQKITELLDQCSKDLDQRYETLLSLKEIEMVIQKQEAIEQAFNAVQISMESIDAATQSIRKKIDALRGVYGIGDWDKRVEFMASNLVSSLPPASNPYVAHLLLYACMEPSHLVTKLPRGNRVNHSPQFPIKFIAGVDMRITLLAHHMWGSEGGAEAWAAAQKLAADTQEAPMEGVFTALKVAAAKASAAVTAEREMAEATKAAAMATEIVNALSKERTIEVADDDADKELIWSMSTAAAEVWQANKSVKGAEAAACEAARKRGSRAAAEAVLWKFMISLSDYMRRADDTMGSEAKNAVAALQYMMKVIYKCDALKILDFFDLFYKNRPLNRTLCAAAILKALEKSAEAAPK
ncbi:hypothetical protein ACFLR2_02375, partial [Chlamydiota bacterium]